MASLGSLSFKKAYHKPEDDIASAFYLPAIALATNYDRAVGFFSSSIYTLAWQSLKSFVANGGRMRLICSPVLSDEDHEAMRQGYSARALAIADEGIRADFRRILATPELAKPAKVLAGLIAEGVIDCRVAFLNNSAGGRSRRLFHDKVGLISDGFDEIVFKGSMNETWPGLSSDGNLESVDVYVSWGGERERERIAEERDYFNRLWNDVWPGVDVVPLPDSTREEIVSASRAGQWPELVTEICIEMDQAARWSPEADRVSGRLPRPHQRQALETWVASGRRGILEHATGSGKTFTALCAINDAFHQEDVPVVIVPSDLLFSQWTRELQQAFKSKGLQLLQCGSGHNQWREAARLRAWTRPRALNDPPRAVLATMKSASSDRFLGLCDDGNHLFIVADEVHRLGATGAQRILTIDSGARLGLSATPARAGDPLGTKAIFDYFGSIIDPPFGIHDAIKAKALTPYAYHVHPLQLAEDEQREWQAATDEYRRLYARVGEEAATSVDTIAARLKMLLIRRARVLKSARGKVDAAVRILQTHYSLGQRWIVYCDDQKQLSNVLNALRSAEVPSVLEYHSAMRGDRERTLSLFDARGGVVVSIRCLDEGVDIPSVSHALILASSRNPREFIQRRGRVLRRAEGKWLAHIHDVLVTPGEGDTGDGTSIVAAEIARAIEFGKHAENPGSITDLKLIAVRMGIDWTTASGGFEVDSDDDELAEEDDRNG